MHVCTYIRSQSYAARKTYGLQIEGEEYIVTGLVLQYKLQRGKYVRDHSKLEVQRTGRFLYNEFLRDMMKLSREHKDFGQQD
jgi:hypothetical protein